MRYGWLSLDISPCEVVCNGYFGDIGYSDGRKCHCFRQREINLLYAQSNIREILKRENFDNFSYEYFDDTKIDGRSGKTAREYMRQVVDTCRQYVDAFGQKKDNIYVQPHQAFNSDLAAAAKASDTVKHMIEWFKCGKTGFDEQLPYYGKAG